MAKKNSTETKSPAKVSSKKTATRATTAAEARPVRVKVPTRTFTFSAPAPSADSPKKDSKKSAPKKSNVTRKTTPGYLKMINKAIESIGHRSGSNIVAISHYIENNYPVKENYKRYLKAAIKRAVGTGELVKNGAMYRVKKVPPKRKRVTKKTVEGEAAAKKPRVKKATTESAASPKKRKADAKVDKVKKPRKTAETSEAPSAITDAPKKPVGLKSDYIWQYLDGHWKNYDVEASNTVEDTYLKYKEDRGETDVRAVKSGSWEYQVDFAAMKQINIQHENHTTRDIRRVKCA